MAEEKQDTGAVIRLGKQIINKSGPGGPFPEAVVAMAFGLALTLYKRTPWFDGAAIALSEQGRPLGVWSVDKPLSTDTFKQLAVPTRALDGCGLVVVQFKPGQAWAPTPKDQRINRTGIHYLRRRGVRFLDRIVLSKNGALSFSVSDEAFGRTQKEA